MILCPRALEQYPSNSSLIEEKPILNSKLCGYNSGLLIANYLMATKVVHNTPLRNNNPKYAQILW